MKDHCFYCVSRLEFPKLQVSLIGTDRKQFKKDFFEFCKGCFEHLFGNNIIFSSNKTECLACHTCNSRIISSIPYSYFIYQNILNNGYHSLGKRRLCTMCSQHNLFPVISSLLIVPTTKSL